MKLAFLSSLLPTGNPDTGLEIANQCLLDALAAAGAEVTVFGYRRRSDTPDPRRRMVDLGTIDIETARAPAAKRLSWIIKSGLSGLPLSAAKLRLMSSQDMIARIAAEGPFDGVIVNTAQMAAAYPEVMARWPSILVAHNVEHASARQNAAFAQGMAAFAYRREAALLQRAEARALAAARYVFFLSEEDRTAFGGPPNSAVLALLTPARQAPQSVAAEHDIGMIGTWTWRPNRIGLDWFLAEIAPKLDSGIVVAIAGRTPPDLAAPSNVRLVGMVPDAAAFLAGGHCVALASRAGTGVQLKTIELMQMGLPAVATASALRGWATGPRMLSWRRMRRRLPLRLTPWSAASGRAIPCGLTARPLRYPSATRWRARSMQGLRPYQPELSQTCITPRR